MNGGQLVWSALRITGKTLERVAEILAMPWEGERYFAACNLPPLAIDTDWAAGVPALRTEIENADPHTDPAEYVSKMVSILEGYQLAIDAARHEHSALALVDIAARLVLPAVMWSLEGELEHSDSALLAGFVTVLMAGVIVDERLQEAYPDSLMGDRWVKLFSAALAELGSSSASRSESSVSLISRFLSLLYYAPSIRNAVLWLLEQLNVYVRDPRDRLRWPFDAYFHQGFDDHPAMPGFEQTLESAQNSVVVFIGSADRTFTANDYLAFDPPAPLWRHRQLAFALVPRTDTMPNGTKLDDGGMYFQLTGDLHREDSGTTGFRNKIDLIGQGGVLFPVNKPVVDKGVQAVGSIGIDCELVYESPDAAPDDDPNGVTLHVRRMTFGSGMTIATVDAASDIWARLRFEQTELRIGKVPVLEYVFSSGARFAFDAGVVVSRQRGVAFEGGLGGEVVIPLDLGFNASIAGHPIASARVRNVHLKVLAADTPDSRKLSLEITTSLSATLFGALTATVEGVGVSWGLDRRDHRIDGNLAGIADMRWETIPPKGIGVALDAWILKGGGFFLYDAEAHRVGGGVEIAIEGFGSLEALGISEPRPGGGGSSWLVVGAATFSPPLGWPVFAVNGLGMIYGSHRKADPDAFLAAMATGGLDAVLFPPNPIANAGQYLATLEKLFPPVDAGEVIGGMISVEAFANALTAQIGLIRDKGTKATNWYLLARLRLQVPDFVDAPISVEAGGVAIWDNARGEFQLRLVLRNSKIFGAELTGEAMIFKGDPDLEDGVHKHVTFISVGGFHPAFTVPSGRIYVPKRLALTWSEGDHVRVEWKLYFAITPGSFQFGISADLVARFSGFGIRGHLAFDLLAASRHEWSVLLELSVELMLGDRTLAGVDLKGVFVGTRPFKFAGRVSVSFLFWSWTSPPFNVLFHHSDAFELAAKVLDDIQAAANATANFKPRGAPGMCLRDAERSGVWVSPSEPLEFRQHVAPLQRAITRYNDAKLSAPETFTIDPLPPPGARWSAVSIDDEFAPGTYLDLTREQQLAARSFEAMPGGFEIRRELETETPVSVELSYEEVIVDPEYVPPQRPYRPLPALLAAAAAKLQVPMASTRVPSRLRREQFAVVGSDLSTVARGLGYMQAHTQRTGEQLVVPATEAA